MSQTKAQLIDNLVQPITGALGSASAPTFSFTSDPNTGLYSPGADQLALTTGGTGRLFVDASGAISTSSTAWQGSPAYQGSGLQIGGTTYAKAVLQTGGTSRAEWFFDSADNYLQAKSGGFYIGNTTANPIGFSTNGSERLRITSAGLVGIGVSAPSTPLHVASQSSAAGINTVATFATPQNANTTSGGAIMLGGFYGDGSGSRISATGNPQLSGAHDLWLQTRATAGTLTNGLFIDATGRVGIGTTSPGDTLHVLGPTAGISARFTDGINATVAISHPSAGTSQISDYGGNYGLRFATASVNILTAGSERARIDSSGRLLVGTSSAAAGASTTTTIIGALLMKSTGLRLISQGGTLDLDLSEGTGIVGHLYVSSTRDSNAAAKTNAVYFISTRLGNNTAITLLNSNNGSTSGSAFTITNPSANIFRFTDTAAGGSVQASIAFVGTIGF
jgi:hypothetical protein